MCLIASHMAPKAGERDLANVVLVEDNEEIRKSLADFLVVSGHTVSETESAIGLYRLIENQSYDVAVVDVNLPHHSGFSVTRYLAENEVCSVIITTVRDSVEDRVRGYDSGADIYMVKPVEPEELCAAIDRLVRKREVDHSTSLEAGAPNVEKWTIDTKIQVLWAPNGSYALLTAREAIFMDTLYEAKGEMLARQDISDHLSKATGPMSRGSFDTMLSRLRTKIRQAVGLELPIVTALNAGIAFTEALERR